MKGLFLPGVAFLLFFFMLFGFEEKKQIDVISPEIQEESHVQKINAVSLPYDSPVVIPEQQLTFSDQSKSDKERKFKASFSVAFGLDLIRDHFSCRQGKWGEKLGLHPLRFILFRNLRL